MPAVRSYYLKAWSGAKIKLQSRYPKITNKNFLWCTEEHGSWVLKSCNCNKKKKPYDLVTAKKWWSRSEFLVETFVSFLKKRIKSVEGKHKNGILVSENNFFGLDWGREGGAVFFKRNARNFSGNKFFHSLNVLRVEMMMMIIIF